MQISDYAGTSTVNLDKGVADLGTSAIKITVLGGGAWITNGKEDIAIKCGQSIELPSSKYAKIMSSLEYDSSVTVKIQRIDNIFSSQPKIPMVKRLRFDNLLKVIIR